MPVLEGGEGRRGREVALLDVGALGDQPQDGGLALDLALEVDRIGGLEETAEDRLEEMRDRLFEMTVVQSVQEATDRLSDRAVDTDDDSLWVTFMGSDFVEEGRRAAKLLGDETKTKPADASGATATTRTTT